ncbi:hypothetical protein LTS12_027336 [Elasticomyces elasticus]|nr:hypothetical protein LTS12_027336 [Elasticomyces elasticus]
MAYFEQLQSKVQTVLELMQHIKMVMENLQDRLSNKTAYHRGDTIRPLRVLYANRTIALPPSAEFQFPDNVWHFWTLPLEHLLALLQFYEIDVSRASDLNSIYHDGSKHRGSHSDSHSMHTAAVDAFRDDALRALAPCQQGTGRKRSRTAPGIAQLPHKKRKQSKGQALVKTTDQFMDAPVVMPGKSALSSHAAAHTKLDWDATAESSSKVEQTKTDASSPHHDCMSLHGSSKNSTTTSMVLSGSKRSPVKTHTSPPPSDTDEDNDEDAEAAVALARRALSE